MTPVGSAATRLRLKSAPTSPAKALYGVTIVSSQAGPSTLSPSRRRKRASLAVTERDGEEEADIAQLALAAVASSRRSPTLSKWQRQPLPFEFRDSDTDSKRSGMNELGANSRNSQVSMYMFTLQRPNIALYSTPMILSPLIVPRLLLPVLLQLERLLLFEIVIKCVG